jgi:hypothetical protein
VVVAHKPDLLRLPTGELLAQRHGLASCVGDLEHVLLGSLAGQMRRCGKVGCRCATGDPHGPYTYFSPRGPARGMKYISAAAAASARAYLRHGERVEAVLAELSAINVELLARHALF